MEWISFIQTVIFLSSAVFAYKAIYFSKKDSRETTTLQLLLDDNKDVIFNDAKNKINSFVDDPVSFYNKHNGSMDDIDLKTLSQVFENEEHNLTQLELDVKRATLTLLNRYEFYAIGLNNHLLDENLFKRLNCSNYIKFWDRVQPAVIQLRTKLKKDTLFKEFELLATRWKSNPLTVEDIYKTQ